jgi:hypothetical protein
MKTRNLILAALFVLGMTGCNNAEDKKNEDDGLPPADTAKAVTDAREAEPAAGATMDSATMAKAWQAYMTPGDMHKWLASTDGKWDAELTFWMGPDAPASQPNKAKVENRTILGGRYQEQIYKGRMDGMDFEGHGTMGYDNAKKKFVSSWIDNMGTGLMYSEGEYDRAAKTINMKGKSIDPATGKELETRSVTRILDDKTQVMEMYCTQNGREYRNMEIKLTKK